MRAWIILCVLSTLPGCLKFSVAQTTGLDDLPENRNDGWSIATAQSAGLATKPLTDLSAAIRSGDFKKIGSVAIARHGKLVYESYGLHSAIRCAMNLSCKIGFPLETGSSGTDGKGTSFTRAVSIAVATRL